MSKKEIKIKTRGEIQNVLEHLESLVNSLKSGKVIIEKNGEIITLVPEGTVSFELEAELKKDKEKIELEIEWKKDGIAEAEENSSFSITSGEEE
ncbi:amphi-Trp domain-containing protein [candidate division WOR-3 bacterium]|nr:amphi-Trp domain-containing protein [candidate division WOR-3 bacterium]